MAIERINFACPIETRDGTLTKDSRAANVVFERNGSFLDILKRPALVAIANLGTGVSESKGISNLNGKIFAISNSQPYTIDPTTLIVSTVVGTVDNYSTQMYFAKAPLEAGLFMQDTYFGYYYAKSGTFNLLTLPTLGVGESYVSGSVFLNSYFFVGTTGNRIYNSKYQDGTNWITGQNYALFEQTTDTLVGIAKHLNYLVAFGKASTQFYYDAGTYVESSPTSYNSPLAVAQSYTSEIGCASGDSIVSVANTVLWIGKSVADGRSIYMMDGVSPVPVSTNAIDRVLEKSDLSKVRAYVHTFGGHSVYVLTLHDLNVTLVYDIQAKEWVQWTSWSGSGSTENYFVGTYYTEINGTSYLLDDNQGVIYSLNVNSYIDNGAAPIYVRIVTEIKDNQSTHRKFYGRLEIVGDKEVNSTMYIRHSGDDYRTWSNYRTVDLSSGRPQLYVGGSDRRRAWEFLHVSNTPLRLECAEIDFRIGEMDQEQGAGRRGH